jgi:hypothetical protein
LSEGFNLWKMENEQDLVEDFEDLRIKEHAKVLEEINDWFSRGQFSIDPNSPLALFRARKEKDYTFSDDCNDWEFLREYVLMYVDDCTDKRKQKMLIKMKTLEFYEETFVDLKTCFDERDSFHKRYTFQFF